MSSTWKDGEEHSKGRSFRNQGLQVCGISHGKAQEFRETGNYREGCQRGMGAESEALGDGT